MEYIVAARVNGVEITMASVAVMMGSLGVERIHGPASRQTAEDARSEALDQLILQELAYQKAKSEGMVVDQEEIDGALAEMRKKLGGEEKLKEFLEKERITYEDLRKRIERNLILKRIFTREVQDKVNVTEEEVRKEYDNNRVRYGRPEKIVATDVVFFLEVGDAGSRKQAGKIRKKIQEDPEKNPWNLVPDGTFVVRDIEVKREQGKGLYEAAKKLKVGELSGVFAAEGNLHILRLKEYIPPRQFPYEEVRGRINAQLRSRAVKKRMEEWGTELKRGARIEIVDTGGHGKPAGE